MAAQVLSGTGNVTYTNSTGQNVRLVINYLRNDTTQATMSFQGVSISTGYGSWGKTLDESISSSTGIPLEIALSNGETFSIINATADNIKGYNIIIIPEAG